MRLRQFSSGELPHLDVIHVNTRLNSKNQLISGNCSNMHCLLNLRMLTADIVKAYIQVYIYDLCFTCLDTLPNSRP